MPDDKIEKIGQIKKLLFSLYCFRSEEIAAYLQAIEKFPQDGLDKFLEVLQTGKKAQDEFLAHRVEEEKAYAGSLSTFVAGATLKLKDEYEKQEKAAAENILQGL